MITINESQEQAIAREMGSDWVEAALYVAKTNRQIDEDIFWSTLAQAWVEFDASKASIKTYLVQLTKWNASKATRRTSGERMGKGIETVSLNVMAHDIEGVETTLVELIDDPNQQSPLEQAMQSDETGRLQAKLALLGDRERLVIEMRVEGKTLHEVGRELGVSHERVRQIEQAAGRKLRR